MPKVAQSKTESIFALDSAQILHDSPTGSVPKPSPTKDKMAGSANSDNSGHPITSKQPDLSEVSLLTFPFASV